MADTPYSSRLRYLDASKADDSSITFDHLPIYGWGREQLGHLDGFVVDAVTGAVAYLVVHAGGWLKSRRFLLPIGHIDRMDAEKKQLVTDVSKDAIRLYPEFDKDQFLALSDDELRDFERQMATACCPGEVNVGSAVWIHETIAHFREPSWWQPGYGQPASASSIRTRTDDREIGTTGAPAQPSGSRHDREHVIARTDEYGTQPGDLLNIHSGGGEHHLGDACEPGEKERRRDE
jgi:hypothetical protein